MEFRIWGTDGAVSWLDGIQKAPPQNGAVVALFKLRFRTRDVSHKNVVASWAQEIIAGFAHGNSMCRWLSPQGEQILQKEYRR